MFQADRKVCIIKGTQIDRRTVIRASRHEESGGLFLCNFTKAPEIRCILLVRMISVTTEVACPHATFSSTL